MSTNRHIIMWPVLLVLGSLLLGCGAAQTTPYTTPEVTMPAQWQASQGSKTDAAQELPVKGIIQFSE